MSVTRNPFIPTGDEEPKPQSIDPEDRLLDGLAFALWTATRPVHEVVEAVEATFDTLRWRDEELLVPICRRPSDVFEMCECICRSDVELAGEGTRREGALAQSVGHAFPGGSAGLSHTGQSARDLKQFSALVATRRRFRLQIHQPGDTVR